MPSCCAATAIGPTGNPTMPNMYCTTCFLRFRATSVAPSISAMSLLLSGRSSAVRTIQGCPAVGNGDRSGDRTVPVEAGRRLAQHIRGARYAERPGDDYLLQAF